MPKRKGKTRAATFDCLSCGATFWLKATSASCPDCNLLMRLRPPGGDKPSYWLKWQCDCLSPCEACVINKEWTLAELARLEQGGGAVKPSNKQTTDAEPMRLL